VPHVFYSEVFEAMVICIWSPSHLCRSLVVLEFFKQPTSSHLWRSLIVLEFFKQPTSSHLCRSLIVLEFFKQPTSSHLCRSLIVLEFFKQPISPLYIPNCVGILQATNVVWGLDRSTPQDPEGLQASVWYLLNSSNPELWDLVCLSMNIWLEEVLGKLG